MKSSIIASLLVQNDTYQQEINQKSADFVDFREKKEIEISELKQRLAWFQKQIFGQKSEKRILGTESRQLSLGEISVCEKPPAPTITVKEYQRKKGTKGCLHVE